MNRPRYTAAQVADALTKAHGIQVRAAAALGCTRQTIDNYIKRYRTVTRAYNTARESLVDRAEDALFSAVDREEPWAIRYALSNLGRKRGYAERTEPIIVNAVDDAQMEAYEAAIMKVYGPDARREVERENAPAA